MPAFNLSTLDIKKSVLRHSGEVDDGTSFYDKNGQVMDYVNKAHVSILDGGNEFDVELSKPWSWAVKKDPGVLILQPDLLGSSANGLSVSVTQNSNAIVFSQVPPFSLAGRLIQVNNRPDFMRISRHVAGQMTATIDAPYADESGSGFYFRAILIDYAIKPTQNGILRLVHALTVYQPQDLQGDDEQKIYFSDENQMARDYPVRTILTGTPTFFTITSKTEDGTYYLRFNKSVDSSKPATRVEFKFIEMPDVLLDNAQNFPVIPRSFRDCLDFAASYFLCLDKNDDRAQMYFQLTQQKLKAMQKAEEKQKTQTSKMRGKLIPRGDIYIRGKRFVVQETS